MSNRDLLAAILSCDSLDGLAELLKSRPRRGLVPALLKLFDAHAEYEDANQWASAVRICEALAIAGWAPRERVDAIGRYTGDNWQTSFVNAQGEARFRLGRWVRRKAGWIQFNPEFHASPDWPGRPSVDWMKYAPGDHPACERHDLPSQRNYQRQMPIVMGRIGGENETTRAVNRLADELEAVLHETMQPARYGEALEHFYFTLLCPYEANSPAAGLKIGTLNVQRQTFACELTFDRGFGKCVPDKQREYFAVNLLAAVSALQAKLRQRQIDYDSDAFRADVEAAIIRFRSAGSKARSSLRKPAP